MENIINICNEFVVIDLETSHFHPQKGGMIIELAAVKIKNNKIIDRRTQLINPERNLTKKIIEITGITDEMLKGKPVFREVLPAFYDFLGNATVVAHNAQFDWNRFLVYFFKKVGIYPTNQVVDTLALSKKYIDSKEGYSLGVLCELLNIEHSNKHRALGDAMATTKLFLYLKNNFINKKSSGGQISFSEMSQENQVQCRPQAVRKVAYWQKQVKNKHFKRFYVTLDRSVVFYDIPTKAWEVKSSNEPINFSEVEKSVLSYMKFASIEELVNHYKN